MNCLITKVLIFFLLLIISDFKTTANLFNNTFNREFKDLKPFDFIIVGSGSSGSILATRLSENPNWNVLLLEAGTEPIKITEVPALCAALQFTEYNWGYLMEEQENMCLGLENKRMHWPRGKALGGSTIINYMMYIRGNRLDFDRWSQNGNEGWSYEELLPLFKKFEDCVIKIQDVPYRNKGGEVGVQDVSSRTKSAEVFVKAMQEYGYNYVDYNGANQIGVSWIQATTRRGRRQSGKTAFLDQVRNRKNLKIITSVRVSKIVFEETKNTKLKAQGVEFIKNNQKYFVKANKEVIISAGALNTPQILLLSGIGPKDHLTSLEIPLLKDLPVGRKLYDHLGFVGLIFKMDGHDLTGDLKKMYSSSSILDYIINGEGPLTTLGGAEALGIVKTNISDDKDPSYPNIELIFLGVGFHSDQGSIFRKTLRVTDEIYNKVWKPLEGKQVFTIIPMLYHPKSYGKVELRSKDYFDNPKFYGNYFTDKDNFDVKTFIAGIRLAQEIIKMPSFQKYNTTIIDTKIPGCEDHDFNTDDYWECALRHLSVTIHHQTTTCKMGNSTDPEAVVDYNLKVYGTENLRVADTSIIPEPISAHTSIPAFMIGEKLADIIKKSEY